MMLRPTCDEEIKVFRELCAGDRIEEQTCRPIVARKPVPRDDRRESWTFVLDGEDMPAGWVNLFDFNSRNRSAEFGYGVILPRRGQGVGKRMLVAAFDEFFPSMGFNKLHCQTASFNTPSVRLLMSLGMRRDAVLRAEHELDGSLYDDYIFSVLRDEWAARKR